MDAEDSAAITGGRRFFFGSGLSADDCALEVSQWVDVRVGR